MLIAIAGNLPPLPASTNAFLAPIIRQTINPSSLFWQPMHHRHSLYPITARGDSTTVCIHHDAPAQHPDLLRMYYNFQQGDSEVACANKPPRPPPNYRTESALSYKSDTANDVFNAMVAMVSPRLCLCVKKSYRAINTFPTLHTSPPASGNNTHPPEVSQVQNTLPVSSAPSENNKHRITYINTLLHCRVPCSKMSRSRLL